MNSATRKNDGYFYTELLEDLKQAERTRQIKSALQLSLAELDRVPAHQACLPEYQHLQQRGRELLNQSAIKPYQMEELQTRRALFIQNNAKQFQDELAEQKARQFIKAQVMTLLQRLHYDVMDDMEVIDFEKDAEFVLTIPDQKNYVHLRFMEDGSCRYNFLIPEFKDDLSIDQIRVKIHEMETACRSFKQHLQKLTTLGIDIDLEKEIPISDKAIIQVPQKLQDKIQRRKNTKTRRKKEETGKKQLSL